MPLLDTSARNGLFSSGVVGQWVPTDCHHLPQPNLPIKNQATTTASSTTKIPSITGSCQFSWFPFRTWLCDPTAEHTTYLSQRTRRNQTYLRGRCGRWGGEEDCESQRRWMATRKWGFLDTAGRLNRSTHNGDDSVLKTCASWSRRNPSTEEGSTKSPSGEALQAIDRH